MNPVDQLNERFNFAGTNARVQARNGRDGPIYRVSFEVDQPTGEMFMSANLVGRIYGGQLMLIDPDSGDAMQENRPQIKGGNLAKDAAILCQHPDFQAFTEQWTHQNTEQAATDYLRWYCGIQSRKELDHDTLASNKFQTLYRQYSAWLRQYNP